MTAILRALGRLRPVILTERKLHDRLQSMFDMGVAWGEASQQERAEFTAWLSAQDLPDGFTIKVSPVAAGRRKGR